LHEGYTADYFLNRMKTNALFPILFIQNTYVIRKKSGTEIFYQIIAQCVRNFIGLFFVLSF
jgi:hypothetical protein